MRIFIEHHRHSMKDHCMFWAVLFGWVALAALPAADTFAQPTADYGDAPDGQNALYAPPYSGIIGNFPTIFSTYNSRYGLPGAHTLDTSDSWLGNVVSMEVDPDDPADPDGVENFIDDDFDDGIVGWPCPAGSPAVPWPSPLSVTMTFEVTVAASAPAVTRYMNILIDLDNDGEWRSAGAEPEWIVMDFPVNVTPGMTQAITVGPFYLPTSNVSKWMRVALTRSEVVGTFVDDGTGWDGGGTFSHGEIEDYLLGGAVAFAAAAALDHEMALASETELAIVVAQSQSLVATIEAIDLSLEVTAAAAAVASAETAALAAAAAEASASAAAAAAAVSCTETSSYASAVSQTCVSCPCASICATAEASALSAVQTCVEAQAAAEAFAAAAVMASAEAVAQASAAAAALVEINLQVEAVAAALAMAQSDAVAIAAAHAEALAQADAAAIAAAGALAAACGGDTEAAAAAAALAIASARAAANAQVVAGVGVRSMTLAYADASVAVALAIATRTETEIASAQATYAQTVAEQAAGACAAAAAASQSTAVGLASASAVIQATCNYECCPTTEISGPFSVQLASFNVTSQNGEVIVNWGTESENRIFGFNILRADESAGIFENINDELIRSNATRAAEYEFMDQAAMPGATYVYQIEAVALSGETQILDSRSVTVEKALPKQLLLHATHPNPSNASTTIRFELPDAAQVLLTVHDVGGRLVRTLINTNLNRDYHSVEWDGRDNQGRNVASGVYIYRLTTGDRVLSKKMVLSK